MRRVVLALALAAGCAPSRPAPAGSPLVLVADDAWLRTPELSVRAGRLEAVVTLDGGVAPERPPDAATTDAVAGDGGTDEPLEIDAPHLRVDARARAAVLDGGVRLRRGELAVESPRVTVRYDERGQPTRLEAEGPVRARWRDAVLEASGAVVLLAPGAPRTITLAGRVRVAREGAVLEGEGVTIDLDTGALEMRAVRGRLPAIAPP